MKFPQKQFLNRLKYLFYKIIEIIYGINWKFKRKSISALIRVKNGEEYLRESVESIADVCEEIVIVNNNSNDSTERIIEIIKKTFPEKVRIYYYNHDVEKLGENTYQLYRKYPTSPELTFNFYNWCFSKCNHPFVLNWDDDMIASNELRKRITSFKKSRFLQYDFGGVNITPDMKKSYEWKAGIEPRISPRFLSKYKYCDFSFVEGKFGGEYIEQWVSNSKVLRDNEDLYAHFKYCKKNPTLNQSKEFSYKISEKLIVSDNLDQEYTQIVNATQRLKSQNANIILSHNGENKKLKIAIVGGSWSSNIGNSFYNVGAEWLLNQLGHDVYFYPESPKWKDDVGDSYDPICDLDVDLVILMGPCLKDRLLYVYEKTFSKLYKRNIKVGYISAGMAIYNSKEAELVSEFLNKYPPLFISTRDHESYRFFVNRVSCPIYSGVCASMFLSDAIQPVKLARKPYIVFNFDETEPSLEIDNDGVASVLERKNNIPPLSHLNFDIIRTNNLSIDEGYDIIYRLPNVYHSDLPQGYCSILAGSQTVYSERVHTCAATLIYGRPAQYISNSSRSYELRNLIFDRIGVPEIFQKPQYLDLDYISNEKNKMIEFLRKAILQ